MRAVVTEQVALALPATFGLPPVEALAGSGDFAFLAGGNSGAFVRRAGAPSPVRILQSGDEVPGVAHSRIDLFTAIRSNAVGGVALQFDYFTGDTTKSAIVTFDGTTFTKVVLASDLAPGGGGAVFGRPTALIGLNHWEPSRSSHRSRRSGLRPERPLARRSMSHRPAAARSASPARATRCQ